MAKVSVDKEKCKGCLLCVAFCPKGLLAQSKKLNRRGANFIEFSRKANKKGGGIPPLAGHDTGECIGCAMCAVICPECCIEVYR